MSSKKWKCLEIHSKSSEERNNLVRDIVELMRQMKKEKHVESYFFNRYSNPKENAFFIKFGLVNADGKAESNVDGILKKNSSIKDIKPYDCEMWKVDDIPIDEIKCIACELHEMIWDGFKDKPTIEQAFYLLHFLMNQLGYSYAEEYRLYKTLEVNIGKKLGK
jgi:hypothetical protein